MLIPSAILSAVCLAASLSRRVNANSQRPQSLRSIVIKLIKKGEC